MKGTPFENDGKYDALTFWEQIDDGQQWTPNRKVLMIIPVAVYGLSLFQLVRTFVPLELN